jgi:hypothetical protein
MSETGAVMLAVTCVFANISHQRRSLMPTGTHSNAPTETAPSPIILDMGSRNKKQIKKLRKGTGKLIDEVNGCIEELKASGTISASAQPVVLIVREKQDPLFPLMPWM